VDEEEGVASGGSAEQEEDMLDVKGIKGTRSQLVEATKLDESLQVARGLAERKAEGYRYQDGVILRSRLDRNGDNRDQICLPLTLRQECMRLAHTKFGHKGRNKMCQLITLFFYWPALSKDCQSFIRKCDTCQRMNKSKQPNSPMPFERVAVDIVGPFPTAKGGFRFMRTCIDLVTRWPEAVPIRTTTSKAIINQLTTMFTHNGFPKAIVSDNGPQFVGKTFSRWLGKNGINHVKSSPYHPQGNGVVERLHRTLKAIITKTTQVKVNWASVVPMALYFIRCVPSEATGLSPFLAKLGWKPSTPLSVLYEAWTDKELGEVDTKDFVLENSERIEGLREASSLKLREGMEMRKEAWDKKAKARSFTVGEEVLTRKPGMCGKLETSWEGPYTIYRKNTPLSYGLDTGDRRIPSVHISLMKPMRSWMIGRRVRLQGFWGNLRIP